MDKNIATSIAPWLSVENGQQTIEFYKAAFNAVEKYRVGSPEAGLVVKLSVGEAEFWVSSEATQNQTDHPVPLMTGAVRLILTVPNPEEIFAQALMAGAEEIFPVGEAHGWRLGRLADPFGLHWEIGHPLPG